jgi:hypothetical protein
LYVLDQPSGDLYLPRSGSQGPWETLALGAPNTGAYLWTITGPEVTGTNAYLLVNVRDYFGNLGTDISNSGFGILTSVADVPASRRGAALVLDAPNPDPVSERAGRTAPVRSRAVLA